MTDNFTCPRAGGRTRRELMTSRRCRNRSSGCAWRSESSGRPGALVLGRRRGPSQNRARPPRRSAAASLTALAANLQLARQLADTDPAAAKVLLDAMGRDIRHALNRTGKLAHRIYPAARGGRPRRGAARRGRRRASRPASRSRQTRAIRPRSPGAVYFCCLEVSRNAREGANGRWRARRGRVPRLRCRRRTASCRRWARRFASASKRSADGSRSCRESAAGTHVVGSLPLYR